MYPDLNVNGVNGANNSSRSDGTQQRKEQDPKDINIFGSSSRSVDDSGESLISRKMNNAKRAAEEASQKTQSHMDRVKYYINKGYSYAKAIEAVEQEEGGPATRAQLVDRLVAQGYDRETAEKLIPKNTDKRLDDARAEGKAEGQKRIDELDKKLNDIRNGKY